jgi:hypothetical protein
VLPFVCIGGSDTDALGPPDTVAQSSRILQCVKLTHPARVNAAYKPAMKSIISRYHEPVRCAILVVRPILAASQLWCAEKRACRQDCPPHKDLTALVPMHVRARPDQLGTLQQLHIAPLPQQCPTCPTRWRPTALCVPRASGGWRSRSQQADFAAKPAPAWPCVLRGSPANGRRSQATRARTN